ncbi:UTP--glucose-1-phosphate uridylyltransferase family [Piptocephalis cylindrospora]|uniref:UTP--glucose-1-phosphate uridylyltransferase n=1 Tax=Piptocephalis cylindrospora TaxID=1907219 RepID=A0A4P9Y851_9FUNG|nr:UTP--glucose-1-phosphate uridylyltransferase family [Piptocephalis cylindrospora]|eukprot:RKP15337.1 UTP--glucose-1-phosphate uridylyltransferase family [Piptocephalis cylindrospora]
MPLTSPESDRPDLPHLKSSTLPDKESRAQAKSMKNELNALCETCDIPGGKDALVKEMEDFYRLFLRYLDGKIRKERLDWSKINSPVPEQIVPYAKLRKAADSSAPGTTAAALGKLAVLKLNGGLGTTMGCVGPKSAIEVRDGLTFLDLTVQQVEHLNTQTPDADVPLVLMNSFNTDRETKRIVRKYTDHNVRIKTFNQSRYPRISKDSLLPVPRNHRSGTVTEWYPPGHGDLYDSLANSGLLDELIAEGREYLFVSNVDNLGATVDTAILEHMESSGAEFLMEVTDKTRADIKGGTLIDYNGQIRLLEIAQVPPEHVEDFKSISKFKIFNTNNLWINLRAVKRVLEAKQLEMEIIVNNKTTEDGEKVLQLETAVGAAIKHFTGAHGINVPRSRFLPVKSTSDLFLITSDLYTLDRGVLTMNPKRMFATVPLVKLGDNFKKVHEFLARFRTIPHILELDHLTVTGDVTFGADVLLRGTVIIVANHGDRIDIPAGSTLENKVVSGNLRILDH